MTPSFDHRKPTRVLYLRTCSRAPFKAAWAAGLLRARNVELAQFPPWPETAYDALAKLPDSKNAEAALRVNTLATVKEVEKRLRDGAFDLALLSDEDCHFATFGKGGAFARARMLAGTLLGSIGSATARSNAAYAKAMRLSIDGIASRLPLAVVDLADAPFVTPAAQPLLRLSTLYFKRELPFDRLFLYYLQRPAPWTQRRPELLEVTAKVRGIPLGLADERYATLKKNRTKEQDIDVLLVSSRTNSMRITAVERLRVWADGKTARVEIHDTLPYETYVNMMARSKVTISIAGGGWDCFRHYEAIALGSVPLMNRPTVDAVRWHTMPDDVFFENTFSNFEARLTTLVNDAPLRSKCLNILQQNIEAHALHSRVIEHIINETLSTWRSGHPDRIALSDCRNNNERVCP